MELPRERCFDCGSDLGTEGFCYECDDYGDEERGTHRRPHEEDYEE